MVAYNIIWWLIFFVLCVIAQSILSGIDFLIIGVIIAMQERRVIQLFWVILAAIFVQEGVGSMPFGSALLWYSSAVIIFYSSRVLFEAENFIFIFLISVSLGFLHYVFTYMMAALHGLSIDTTRLAVESLIQALIIPPLWQLVHFLRKRVMPREDRA